MITGLQIGDRVALIYGHHHTLAFELTLPDGTNWNLGALTSQIVLGDKEDEDEDLTSSDPLNKRSLAIVMNTINVGLALVAGVKLKFKGYCDITTFALIERIYGADEGESNTYWHTTPPPDQLSEATPQEDREIFEKIFWQNEPLDGEYGKMAMLFEIVPLEDEASAT